MHQNPGEGEVLVLPDVGQLVLRTETLRTSPRESLVDAAQLHQRPRTLRRNRLHVRRVVADVHAFRLLEQRYRPGQIPFGFTKPRAGDSPTVGELGQTQVLAQCLDPLQMVGSRREIVAFKGDLGPVRAPCPQYRAVVRRPHGLRRVEVHPRSCAGRRRAGLG